MQKLHFFIDTHDSVNGTFPKGITPSQLAEFYASYEAACAEEGVVSINIQVGFEEGRAFCLTMAPNAEAVKRAHEKVGLPYDNITQVNSIAPSDLALLK